LRGDQSAPDAPNPRVTVHEATKPSPVTALINRAATRSHAGFGLTLVLATSAGTTFMGRGTSNVLSYRYATGSESAHTGYSTTNVAAQQGYERSDGTLTRRIPIPRWMWSATTAPIGDSPAFALVRACVEPPAGIEPATPSLPWNHREPLCGPPFPQLTPDRKGQSYRFSLSKGYAFTSGQMLRSRGQAIIR
jgi:hypothetical protein